MDAKLLRFVIDRDSYRPSPEQIVRLIESKLPDLMEKDIFLALENHDRLKAIEYLEILDRIDNPYVGICLDTANSLGAGESLEWVAPILAPYTLNLHIKDIGITRLNHKQGFVVEGRVAGKGIVNIPEIIKAVSKSGKCMSCILEQWVPVEKDPQLTLLKEEIWAKKSIKYLKKCVQSLTS
jgi:sugar phosphate isomerase/epimerase